VIAASLLETAAATAQVLPPVVSQERLRQLERERVLREQQAVRPEVRLPLGEVARPAGTLRMEGETCLPIERVELWGEEAARFQWALAAARIDAGAVLLPACLSAPQLNELLQGVQNAILERGYITTRVLAEPQDLRAGILRLTLIPGRLHAVRMVADAAGRMPPARLRTAVPTRPGELLNLRDLEQALENFERVPSADADIQIVPAEGSAVRAGDSDLLIRWQQALPVRLSVGGDDAGTDSTGVYQGSATMFFDNVARLNDLAYVSVNRALGGGDPGERGTSGYTAQYSVPWGDWELALTSSRNRNRQSIAGIEQAFLYRGRSDTTDIELSRVVYRDAVRKTSVSLQGFAQSSKNFIDDTEIQVQRRRVRGVELGVRHRERMGDSSLEVSLGYRRGTEQKNLFGLPLDSLGFEVEHPSILTASAQWSMPFSVAGQAVSYSLAWRAQWDLTRLVSQDGFAIGGRFAVRGFDGENILSAERGWSVRNDLSAALGRTGQALFVGVDYGEVDGPSAPTLVGTHLAGAVLGLRGGYGQWAYEVFAGQPLERPKGFVTAKQVAGFNVSWSF
jgi:hemolysin activation/secretion protein